MIKNKNKNKNNNKNNSDEIRISASEINQFIYSPSLWYEKKTGKKIKKISLDRYIINRHKYKTKKNKILNKSLKKRFKSGNKFHKYFLFRYNLCAFFRRMKFYFFLSALLIFFYFYLLNYY
jgi:uncharacterized membrane protein